MEVVSINGARQRFAEEQGADYGAKPHDKDRQFGTQKADKQASTARTRTRIVDVGVKTGAAAP